MTKQNIYVAWTWSWTCGSRNRTKKWGKIIEKKCERGHVKPRTGMNKKINKKKKKNILCYSSMYNQRCIVSGECSMKKKGKKYWTTATKIISRMNNETLKKNPVKREAVHFAKNINVGKREKAEFNVLGNGSKVQENTFCIIFFFHARMVFKNIGWLIAQSFIYMHLYSSIFLGRNETKSIHIAHCTCIAETKLFCVLNRIKLWMVIIKSTCKANDHYKHAVLCVFSPLLSTGLHFTSYANG